MLALEVINGDQMSDRFYRESQQDELFAWVWGMRREE